MATWHQNRARTPLWHETKWTIVSDPPNGCTTVSRVDTKEEAEAYLARIKVREPYSFILRPSREYP